MRLVKSKKSSIHTHKNRRPRRHPNHTIRCRSTHIDTDVVSTFMTMLMIIKLYHWNTCNYAQHKATDELYEALNGHMDKFIETTLGNNNISTTRWGRRRQEQPLNLRVANLSSSSQNTFVNHIQRFLHYVNNTLKKKYSGHNDLINILDDIDVDLHKFLYLMTLK